MGNREPRHIFFIMAVKCPFRNDVQILSKDEFIIDKDMFGGGFIKAVQADSDQELELVVWSSHEKERIGKLYCFSPEQYP